MILLKRVTMVFCCILVAGCLAPGLTIAQNEEPEPPEEEKENVYVAVEDMPELKGGLAELQQKIEYPETARKAGIEGRVIIQFVINKKGEVEEPEVLRGISDACNKEAVRVIKQAEFVPGKQRGEPVRVQYSLPITFQLGD